MAYKKIQIVLALDGQEEFRQGISNANKEAQNLQSQLGKLSSEYEGNANSLEYLTKKQDLLTQQEAQYQKKLEGSKKALEQAKTTQKNAAEQYEKLAKEVDEAKEALQKMADAGEEGTKEYQKQAKEVESLEKALNKQGTQCTKCEGVISDYNKKVNTAETQVNKTNTELKKNATYLDEAKNSTDKCATSIDKFGNEAKEATTVTTSFGEKLKTAITDKVTSEGIDLLKEGLQEVVEVAKEVIEVGSDFEASMSNVAALSGATGEELDALTEKAKEMGETTKYTASEAADAFSYMALAGWDTEEMLEGIDGVLNLAAAADMDLAEASDIVTDYLTAFGLSASDSADFVDMMAYAMANSNTTVEDLGEAYKNCAATASSLGYSAEEVTAVLATMANAGVKGGEAGTALNTIMTRLATDTKDCATELKKYGVEVYDSEGNMNSLSSILEGMSGIWEDLTDEQQANLAKTIAGTSQYSSLQTIMTGLSEQAEESGKSFSDYAEALEDCSGTAADMAETMQDNLSGDLTKMNSALQGLEIAAYDYIDGPLRSVVQGVTGLIGNMTDAITPQESNLESLVKTAKEAKNNIDSVLSSAQSTVTDAETSAAEIELLGQQLLSLNSTEDLSLTQKERLKTIVDELSESIPELAEAYNEETGYVDLNNEAIQDLITSSKELMITNAMQTAMEDEMAALAEATVALEKAKIAQESYENELSFWSDYQTKIQALSDSYDEYISLQNTGQDTTEILEQRSRELTEAQALLQQAFEDGSISAEEYEKELAELSDMDATSSVSDNGAIARVAANIADYAYEADQAAKTTEELQANVDEVQESCDTLAEACTNITAEQEEATEATENYALATDQSTESVDKSALSMENATSAVNPFSKEVQNATKSTEELGEAEEDTADSTDELESALDDAATAAEKSAEAQKSAFETIYDSYTSTFESIKSDLENKLDLSSKFDGGDDTPVTQMIANLQDQVEGLQTYQENLEKVKNMTDETGKSIFSDEMIQQLEEGGTDMANTLARFVMAYETEGEGGLERLQTLAEEWQEYMDISDEIATAGAANQTAYELAMGELGSTELDFSDLQDAIDEAVEAAGDGWSGLADETHQALQDAVDMAKSMGVQIPDGLADAISSGETSAEQATEQLNSAIQGTLEGLLKVAQESGATVSDELAASITDGTADAEAAMSELLSALSSTTGDSSEVSEAVDTAVSGGADAISNSSEDYSEGGSELSTSIADGITESTEEISTAAEEAAQAGAEAAQSDANIEAYKEAGKALAQGIIDGIAEGMSESESEASDSFTELGAAIAEAAAEILNGSSVISQFTDAGTNAALAYIEALGAEDSSVAFQAREMAQAAVDVLNETALFESAGNAAAFAYNTPFGSAEMTGDAATQAAALVKSVTDELNSHIASFEAYGNESSSAYAVAIGSASDTAASKAKAMAAQALSGAKSNQDSFKVAGQNMSAGVAAGITAGQSGVITAAKTMAAAALNAAKAELEIQSPSKKFKNAVGKQISAGMAFGISDNASLAGDAAEEMSNSVYSKATSWLAKYKKSHTVSLADEKYYWQQVAQHCEEGTTAYNNAIAKMITASVSKKDSSGNKKDTETYYSDILDAAEDYMEKQQILNDVSISDQISYWTAIKKQLKSGTDAWYEATEKLNELQEEYYDSIVSNAEDTMKKRKILEDVSVEEELAYWQEILQLLEDEGQKYSDNWYDVYETVSDLQEDYYDGIVSDAKDAMEKKKILEDVSTAEELVYWKNILQQLEDEGQKYTDNWYDVYEKVSDLQQDYYDEIVSDAKDAMEKKKILEDVSVKDELTYWQRILQQLEDNGQKYTDNWYDVYEKCKDLQEEYYDDLISSAEDTMDKRKILEDVSVAEELSYWQGILKQLEGEGQQYTDDWYTVYEKCKNLQEDFYDDILSTAEDELDKYETLNETSLSDELAYWEKYLTQFEEGTDNWYTIVKKINNIKSQIGTVSAAQSLLSAYQTYFEMSELAEMEYWDAVRKQYEEGTDERLQADQEYFEAKEAYYEKLEELEEDYADSVKQTEEDLADDIQSLWDDYNSTVESRTQEIADAFGLFDEFYSESDDGQTLLYNLQTQVAGYQDWADTLKALEQRGILSEELLDELTEMGPEYSASLHALYDLTDEELTAYNEAYTQKMDIATQQAEEENEDLKSTVETQVTILKAQAEDTLEELKAEYEKNVDAVNTEIATDISVLAYSIQSIAEDQTTSLVNAILQSQSSSSSEATTITGTAASAVLSSGTVIDTSGYASGGRNINDDLVWMDEKLDSKGGELVVSRSDNALLTRLPSGSNDIIDADTTSNLLRLAQIDPDELLSVVAKQQNAATMYLDELNSAGSTAQINDLTAMDSYGSAATADTSTMEGMLSSMIEVMAQYLPYLAEKTQVVLDPDDIVDKVSSNVGSALMKESRRSR